MGAILSLDILIIQRRQTGAEEKLYVTGKEVEVKEEAVWCFVLLSELV